MDRPYFYGSGMDATIHAYAKNEWGLGGSQPFGNYSAKTLPGLYVVTTLMTAPAVLAPLLLILSVVGLNLGVFLLAAVCTALFTGGWLLGISTVRQEHRAAKRRRLRGLPTPRLIHSDDQARKWFEERPGTVEITRDNFPESSHPFPDERSTAGAARDEDSQWRPHQ